MITNTNTYNPDYAVHPGEILKETLEARNIKKNEFAERCGMSVKTISQILNSKAPVTADTAIQFERILGVSAELWNNLDANYRLFDARSREKSALEQYKDWIKRFPVNELKKRGYLPESKDISVLTESILSFFGVSSPEAWEDTYKNITVAYRKSNKFKDSIESIVSWLRIGIIKAEEIETEPFNKDKFVINLTRIKKLTRLEPSISMNEVKNLCAESGVALVFVPEFRSTHLSGATMWLSKDKALIVMSLRHKSDDHFWFTFFHEAVHIVRHGKKDIFIDEYVSGKNKDDVRSEEEAEADNFAQQILIDERDYKKFVSMNATCLYPDVIEDFAETIGISPGIVVGRLQHDGFIPYSFHNGLKRKIDLEAV